jgi:phage protein U
MATLRNMAAQGIPYTLLDGTGQLYGRWSVTRVDETKSIFAAFAQPKKIEFAVTLAYFDGAPSSLLPNLSGTLLGDAISGLSQLL